MDWTILTPIAGAVVYSLLGWMKNALEDGEISTYEWKMLLATIVQTGILSAAAMFGLHTDAVTATGLAVLGNVGISTAGKVGNKY